MSDAPIDDWEHFVTEKALLDAGKVVWLEARVRQLEDERNRLRAVVDAAREWHRLHRAAEHQGHRLVARRTLFALLDELDATSTGEGT